MSKPFMTGEAPDLDLVKHAIDELIPPVFDHVEPQLPEQGFFFGDMTIADISLISAVINATYTGFEVDAKRWPKLSAYLDLVKSHPDVAKCLEAVAPLIDALRKSKQDQPA